MESNLPLPYELTCEDGLSYSFTTDFGVKYHLYFFDFSYAHPLFTDVYTFNIETEDPSPHAIDNRIVATVVSLLKSFFAQNQNAMIMVCDTLDGKERKRFALFSRWFSRYNEGYLNKFDASVDTGDYNLYASLYLAKSNPMAQTLVSAFYELVKSSFYPVE